MLRAVRLTGQRQRGLGEFKIEIKFGADACEPIDNLDVIGNPAPAPPFGLLRLRQAGV